MVEEGGGYGEDVSGYSGDFQLYISFIVFFNLIIYKILNIALLIKYNLGLSCAKPS